MENLGYVRGFSLYHSNTHSNTHTLHTGTEHPKRQENIHIPSICDEREQGRERTDVEEQTKIQQERDGTKGIVQKEKRSGKRSMETHQVDVEESKIVRKALRIGSDTEHLVNETERTIKFGLFSLTLMFFRSMKVLKKEKDVWAPGNELTRRKKKKQISKERKIMMQEERNRSRRLLRVHSFVPKSERKENETEKSSCTSCKKTACVQAQHAARKSRVRRKLQHCFEVTRLESSPNDGLELLRRTKPRKHSHVLAIVLQSTWRMYVARCIVHERRQELLHFLEKMKAEEAKLLEEEYWRVNVFARYKRALRNKLRSSKKKKAEDAEASEMNREAIPRWYRHEMPSAAPKDDGEGDDDSEYEYYGEDYDGEDDNFSDISCEDEVDT